MKIAVHPDGPSGPGWSGQCGFPGSQRQVSAGSASQRCCAADNRITGNQRTAPELIDWPAGRVDRLQGGDESREPSRRLSHVLGR